MSATNSTNISSKTTLSMLHRGVESNLIKDDFIATNDRCKALSKGIKHLSSSDYKTAQEYTQVFHLIVIKLHTDFEGFQKELY